MAFTPLIAAAPSSLFERAGKREAARLTHRPIRFQYRLFGRHCLGAPHGGRKTANYESALTNGNTGTEAPIIRS